MAAFGHFGCPKFTLDRISGHFRSIGHFGFQKLTNKWLSVAICGYMWLYVAKSGFMSAILDVRNSLSIAFLATSDRYATLIFLEFF